MTSYGVGLIYIFVGALLWSATAVIVQYLSVEFNFISPFLITYIGCCLFTLLIPSSLAFEKEHNSKLLRKQIFNDLEAVHVSSYDGNDVNATENSLLINNKSNTSNDIIRGEETSTKDIVKRYLSAAAQVAPMWWMSNYCYNYSLSYTTITSSTIISNMGCVFTFLFALSFRQEKYNNIKLTGVILAFLGSVLTSLNDAESASSHIKYYENEKLWGDVGALLSALGHAGYTVVVRKVNPVDENLNMSLLLGFVGLILSILLGPYAVFTLKTGNLLLSFNPAGIKWQVMTWLVIKGLFGNLLPDYFWGRAIVLTSATVATIGLNITIPLAFLSDAFIMNRNVWTFDSIFGAMMVIVGFIFVNKE